MQRGIAMLSVYLVAVGIRAPDAGDALAPVTAEAKGGGGVGDEGKTKLAVERGVAFPADSFERRKTLPEEVPEESRLPWSVLRPVSCCGGYL
jgi:hypothetical protein